MAMRSAESHSNPTVLLSMRMSS